MAYRVTYGESDKKQNAVNELRIARIQLFSAVFLILFVLAVKSVWKDGSDLLCSYLIPGEPTAAQQAFERCVRDIQDGEPVKEAFAVFFQGMIDNDTAP